MTTRGLQLPEFQNGRHSNVPSLRAVPSGVINRIRRGEFVNFDTLLPGNIGRPAASTISFNVDGDNIQISSASDSQPNRQSRARIVDIFTWALTWTLFFQILKTYNINLVDKLLQYQLFIVNLASQYNFSAWYGSQRALYVQKTYILGPYYVQPDINLI